MHAALVWCFDVTIEKNYGCASCQMPLIELPKPIKNMINNLSYITSLNDLNNLLICKLFMIFIQKRQLSLNDTDHEKAKSGSSFNKICADQSHSAILSA